MNGIDFLLIISISTILDFLLNLGKINVSDFRGFTVKDLGQFFKSRAPGLNIEEVDEDEFDKDPNLLK
jgi:hypothetical protein